MSVNMKVLIRRCRGVVNDGCNSGKKTGQGSCINWAIIRTRKKILATGNGKCNFTNRFLSHEHYCASSSNFVDAVINQFSNQDTIQFFYELGVLSKERNGYYYPNSNQASSIRDALWNECAHLGVEIRLACKIWNIENVNGCFLIQTSQELFNRGKFDFCIRIVSQTNLGSDGSAFQYIEKIVSKPKDIVPGLVQMKSEQSIFKHLAGIRSDVTMELWQIKSNFYFEIKENFNWPIMVFQGCFLHEFTGKYLHEKRCWIGHWHFVPFLVTEQWVDLVKEMVQT